LKIENINVEQAINQVKKVMDEDKTLSSSLRTSLELLLVLVSILLNRLNLNSKNSSKPPSSDPNREKGNKNGNGNKAGGQKGHVGKHLKLVEDPDKIEDIKVDRTTLPKGKTFQSIGYEQRQIFDIDISQFVTEYRAEILQDEAGRKVVAPFPKYVTTKTQYGTGVKIHAVYMSNYQFIPYKRIEEHFADQFAIPLSSGSIYNFNKDAYNRLEPFEQWLKNQLQKEKLLHADETGININGKRQWLHVVSNSKLTYFMPHTKRGFDAIEQMGVLPNYTGILVHDHWKPYYKLNNAIHVLCNAHHLRELERAYEQDNQKWAKQMQELLLEINTAVGIAGGMLNSQNAQAFRSRYREILNNAEQESPPPDESKRKEGQRGRTKRSKARNLLERLRDFESDVLRFMELEIVPFTNNQGENDLRMTKVQQKISGCFRSELGAQMSCRIRSYLETCRKNNISSAQALKLLFDGKWPEFIKIAE